MGLRIPGWRQLRAARLSISAEWTAYLLFPLALLLVRPLRHLPAAVLLTAAVAAMAPLAVGAFLHGTPDSEQNWVLRLACGFTSGILAALALRRLRAGRRLEAVALATVWTAVFLVLTGASWAAWAAWRLGPDGDQDFNGVVILVFPLLVVGLSLTERGPARWLASRPMIYGGELSYCLYLVHFLVLELVVSVWWQDPGDRDVITPGLVLAVPGIVLLSLLASAALHHGVEKPARLLVLRLAGGRRKGARGEGARTLVPPPAAEPALVPAPAAEPALVPVAASVPAPATQEVLVGRPRPPVASPGVLTRHNASSPVRTAAMAVPAHPSARYSSRA